MGIVRHGENHSRSNNSSKRGKDEGSELHFEVVEGITSVSN